MNEIYIVFICLLISLLLSNKGFSLPTLSIPKEPTNEFVETRSPNGRAPSMLGSSVVGSSSSKTISCDGRQKLIPKSQLSGAVYKSKRYSSGGQRRKAPSSSTEFLNTTCFNPKFEFQKIDSRDVHNTQALRLIIKNDAIKTTSGEKMSSKLEQCLKDNGEIVCEEGGCRFDMDKISFSEPRQMFFENFDLSSFDKTKPISILYGSPKSGDDSGSLSEAFCFKDEKLNSQEYLVGVKEAQDNKLIKICEENNLRDISRTYQF